MATSRGSRRSRAASSSAGRASTRRASPRGSRARAMAKRVIHVGVGSFGQRWLSEFLAANIADRTIAVVALVDVDEKALAFGRGVLGLPQSACHTDAAEAFAAHAADFCTVVVPPDRPGAVIDAARAHGLDILCEKPIADTMTGSLRIARKVHAAGRKMAVTMSHRFDQDKTTLRRIVRSGSLGKVTTVSCRCAATWNGAPASATPCAIL